MVILYVYMIWLSDDEHLFTTWAVSWKAQCRQINTDKLLLMSIISNGHTSCHENDETCGTTFLDDHGIQILSQYVCTYWKNTAKPNTLSISSLVLQKALHVQHVNCTVSDPVTSSPVYNIYHSLILFCHAVRNCQFDICSKKQMQPWRNLYISMLCTDWQRAAILQNNHNANCSSAAYSEEYMARHTLDSNTCNVMQGINKIGSTSRRC